MRLHEQSLCQIKGIFYINGLLATTAAVLQ
ncbi:MAG: hypothetical protein JWM91_3890 [Rhodospirillales bacterium]|nr:hypothetical protein [Rhodospirillales bacterium]